MASQTAILRDIADLKLDPQKAHGVGANGRLKSPQKTEDATTFVIENKVTEPEVIETPVVANEPVIEPVVEPVTEPVVETKPEPKVETEKAPEEAPAVVEKPVEPAVEAPAKETAKSKKNKKESVAE